MADELLNSLYGIFIWVFCCSKVCESSNYIYISSVEDFPACQFSFSWVSSAKSTLTLLVTHSIHVPGKQWEVELQFLWYPEGHIIIRELYADQTGTCFALHNSSGSCVSWCERLDKLRPSIHANSFHLTTIGNSSSSYSLKLGYTGFLGVLGGSWHSISSGIDSERLRNDLLCATLTWLTIQSNSETK